MKTHNEHRIDNFVYNHVSTLVNKIGTVTTAIEFEELVGSDFRSAIPHSMSVCGIGEIRSGLIYELINIGMPDDYLLLVLGHHASEKVLDCPVTREWLRQRRTLLIKDPQLIKGASKLWVSAIDQYNIRNVVIGGVPDISGKLTSVFCFVGIPEDKCELYLNWIDLTILALHKALVTIYRINKSSEKKNNTRITQRETEILYWLYQGLSNEGIASKAQISINTVRCHVKNIMLKMRVTSRTQALARAISEGHINT